MGIGFVDMNGQAATSSMAVFMCDVCQDPILSPRAGLIVWRREWSVDGNRHPHIAVLSSVHRGACDRTWELTIGAGGNTHARDLEDVVKDLALNAEEQFEPETDVEYLAPRPSKWTSGAGTAQRGSKSA
jgi:hypothetical protein